MNSSEFSMRVKGRKRIGEIVVKANDYAENLTGASSCEYSAHVVPARLDWLQEFAFA